ncbi:MAG: sulfatase family protein [Actinomycetes bacterium]
MSRHNVVLILCDQMQYRQQGWVDGVARTPNLDRFARENVAFTSMFVSCPQCTPSRVSLQTGLYPHEAHVMTNYGFFDHTAHLGPEHLSVGMVFRDAGYATAYFGKSHLGYPLTELGYDHAVEHGGVPGELARVDAQITRDAITFVRDHGRGRPLFLTVSWHEPHPPFELVERFAANYRPETFVPPASFADSLAGKPEFIGRRRQEAEGRMDPDRFSGEQLRYLTMISNIDSEFRLLRSGLEQLDLWDDTVVVFTSDHGDLMGAHGMRLKGTLPYDELLRVPMLLHAPGRERTRAVVDDLVSNVAIPGTLMDLAGIGRPVAWPDRSLVHVLDTPVDPESQAIYAEHYAAYWGVHPLRLVRTRRWKYVRYYGPDEPTRELYDLETDPHELHNLSVGSEDSARSEYHDVEEALDAKLERWWVETGGYDFTTYEGDDFRYNGKANLLADNAKWGFT